MILPAFTGCSEETPAVTDTSAEAQTSDTAVTETTAPETTEEQTTLRSQVKDNVPDDLKFSGETVRVLHRDSDTIEQYDVTGTENSGDYVPDSVWMRNMNIEDRLNITFEFSPCGATGIGGTSTFIKSIVMSDSNEFDYILTTGNTNITAGNNDYLRDLSDLPHADYSSP